MEFVEHQSCFVRSSTGSVLVYRSRRLECGELGADQLGEPAADLQPTGEVVVRHVLVRDHPHPPAVAAAGPCRLSWLGSSKLRDSLKDPQTTRGAHVPRHNPCRHARARPPLDRAVQQQQQQQHQQQWTMAHRQSGAAHAGSLPRQPPRAPSPCPMLRARSVQIGTASGGHAGPGKQCHCFISRCQAAGQDQAHLLCTNLKAP